MRVVVPRRAVHERVQRIAIDDEVALSRDEKDLAAAAGKYPRANISSQGCLAVAGGFATVAGGTDDARQLAQPNARIRSRKRER